MEPAIQTENLSKNFRGKQVLHNLSVGIDQGKITAVLGPNGAGKSTFLNLLAGVIKPDAGKVEITNFNRFRFSYVFQNYRDSLLPWQTNEANLLYPLKIQKLSGAAQRERLSRLLPVLEQSRIKPDAFPYELSGGQQQILAFQRALITEPSVILLDEPFSALDYENALQMLNTLQEYYLRTRATVVIITHDIEEAVFVANKILVFSRSPAAVVGEIANELPYSRTIETMKQAAFHQTKNKALELFQQTVTLL